MFKLPRKGLNMQFIHYKEYPPVNLAKVGTIGKENQQITENQSIYAISFFEFERKVAYWVFQSEEERETVFNTIRAQFSKDIGKPQTTYVPPKPVTVRG